MSDNGGLPRSILDTFAKDLRTKRFFERLQDQAMVLLPEQIAVINAAIEDAQGSADDAFTLAHAANTRPIDDVELLPILIHPENEFELLPIFVHAPDDCELLPVHVKRHDTMHGWAQYNDDAYTVGSPFSIAEGVTASLPNNAATVLEGFLPLGVSSFYDGTKIRPDSIGDYYIITIRFVAACSKLSGHTELSIDIGGTQGQIFKSSIIFPKGIGVFDTFNIPLPCFALDTFKANGGIVKLEALLGDLTIYSISYQVARVFGSQGV